MPAFTATAAYLVTSAFGAAFAATAAGIFVTSVVAVGLAVVTSNLINGTGDQGTGSGGTRQDPGVRQQLPPATNNKVGIVYGSAFQKGTVSDARISSDNKTMTYILQLSEKTQTGAFSVGDIFWNDQKLVFKTDPGSEHIVGSSIDQSGTGASNTNYDGLIRVRVYAGSVAPANQIFPLQATGNITTATVALGETDPNYLLNGLVFAQVQIDYNSQKGITGLSQVSFQLNNSLKNPGNVWYDYLTSDRYGAGIPTSQVDTVSSISTTTSTSLFSISNQIPANQYLAGGTTATNQARYEINGILSAGDTVKNNLDRINVASASWTTFDYTQGKWKLTVNRAATAGELAQAFVFNDDNIIGDIGITATNLEDLYNLLEVEYSSRKIRDQNDYFRAAIAAEERNDLEPDNMLNLRIDLSNNALHSARIGLIELKQSRVDLIITFKADYSALQCSAGDVIKVTTPVYGFNQKLFRITKIREIEDENGGIGCEITALQYNADVYTDETLQDSASVPGSGIPTFGGSSTLPAPSTPIVTTINTTTPSFIISTIIGAGSTAVDEVQWWYNTTSTGSFSYFANEYSSVGTFGANTTVTDIVSLPQSGVFYFKARSGIGGRYSDYSAASSPGFSWNPNDYGGI